MLPIMLIIVVLPLAVRLAIYSCGYSGYEWYSTNDVLSDFYCYYKSYLLDVIGIFAGIILIFRMTLYGEKTRNMKLFISLIIYCIFVLLSTIFSVNTDASVRGNFESFESCIVLIVYTILALYAYQIMEYERDYKYIWYTILAVTAIFAIIGAFQIFGRDLMHFQWIQRLIMSKEQFSLYSGEIEDSFTGNNVYLTLYNPNYAGITLCMLFAVIWSMALSETVKKNRIIYFAFSAVTMTLIWFTYSRASLLAVLLILILGFAKNRKNTTKKQSFAILSGFIALFIIFICVDASLDFKYLSRIIDKNTREPLTGMTTDEKGIHIVYDDTDYLLYIENDTLLLTADGTETPLSVAEGIEMTLPMGKDAKAVLCDNEIYLSVADNTLSFIHENDTYSYLTPSGTAAQMVPVEAADFHGLEYLGSARGYIWSRTLPLLDEYLLIGSGPDTFAEVFPQHDYAGKVVYSDRPDMIIEKAHNDYLTKWVQTGGISVFCIIIFYVLFIRWGIKGFIQKPAGSSNTAESLQTRLGYGCYVACLSYMFTSLFNDSTLQTSPFFWVFAGIALSSMADNIQLRH